MGLVATVLNTSTDDGYISEDRGTFKTDQPSFTNDIKDPSEHQYKRTPKTTNLWKPKNICFPLVLLVLFCLHLSATQQQLDCGKLL